VFRQNQASAERNTPTEIGLLHTPYILRE
jgi:hypothetical protein